MDLNRTFLVRIVVLISSLAVFTVEAESTTPPPPKHLLANAGLDQHVNGGTKVVLSGSGRGPNGRIVKFAWAQIDGPRVALRNANRSTANFTAPKVSTDTTLVFRLTVADVRGFRASDTATITVVSPKPKAEPKPEPEKGSAPST